MRRRLPVLLCCLALVLAAVAAAQQPLPVLHWGFRGQVGAAYLGSNVPLHVSMPNAIAVAGGFYSSAAIAADGHVWTWGTNSSGQLGDGTNTDRADPVAVVNLDRVVAIAAGSFHVLALRDDHTVWAWGLNQSGQLGNGTRTNANAVARSGRDSRRAAVMFSVPLQWDLPANKPQHDWLSSQAQWTPTVTRSLAFAVKFGSCTMAGSIFTFCVSGSVPI